MAGIRCDNPIGPGWEYSLDQTSWQISPKFFERSPGVPFVLGTIYTVYCRHQADELTAQQSIPFGEAASDDLISIAKMLSPKLRDSLFNVLLGSLSKETLLLLTQQVFKSMTSEEFKIICTGLAQIGCSSKTVSDFRIDGPYRVSDNALLPEVPSGTPVYFKGFVVYNDGTSSEITSGHTWSIVGTGDSINQAGQWTPLGAPRTVTVNLSYALPGQEGKTKQKNVNVVGANYVILTSTGVVKYFKGLTVNEPRPDGSLESVTCGQITGWLKDRNNPNNPYTGRLFINGVFADYVTATDMRDDVDPYLGDSGNSGGYIYGFKYIVPGKYRTGGKITAELRPMTGNTAFRNSPKTSADACLDVSNLVNVSGGASATSNAATENNPIWTISNLVDSTDNIWTSVCINPTDPVTVTLDLNGTAAPQQIKLRPRQDDPGAMPVSYYIDGSLNGTDWFRMVTVNSQTRGKADVLLEVEKDLSGNYRTCRYVRLTTTANGAAANDCSRVQLAEFSVLAPSLTPLDGTPVTRQPKSLHIFGENAMREGTTITAQVMLFYTNGDSEDVTASAARSTGNDFALSWGGDSKLSAATNGISGDQRSSTISATYMGLSASKVINIYDATIAVYVKSYRIDRIEDSANIIEGGEAAHYKITAIKSDDSVFQYTGGGAYRIEEPYPNGMSASTAAAVGTITLPANSITGNLTRKLFFDFPDNGGTIETVMSLINVEAPAANRPPTMGAIGDRVVTAAGTQTIVLDAALASDPDGDTLTWSATQTTGLDLPAGLSFDFSSRTFSISGMMANTQVAIRVTVSDGELTAYNEFLLTINRTSSNPTVNAPGISASRTMPICSGANDNVTLTATNIDAGASVVWSNGATTTSITVSNNGIYRVHAVKNGVSSADTSFEVVSINPVAPIVKASKFLITAGESITLTAQGANGIVKWYKDGTDTGLRGTPLTLKPTATGEWKAKSSAGSCESDFSNAVRVTVS